MLNKDINNIREKCRKILNKHTGIDIKYLTDEKLYIDFYGVFDWDNPVDDLNNYIDKLRLEFKIESELYIEQDVGVGFEYVVKMIFDEM
jgi:hypothetical protein